MSANAIGFVQVRRVLARTLLRVDPRKGQLGYNKYVDDFATLVNFAQQILEPGNFAIEDHDVYTRHDFTGKYLQDRPYFSLAMGVAEPLYLVATRCREPTIQRRALRLLKLHPRREGIWETTLGAKIAEVGMLSEEKACPQRNPASVSRSSTCSEGAWICENHRLVGGVVSHLRTAGADGAEDSGGAPVGQAGD
ncbi:hypothetical protein VTN77DRAFT_1337 [Rasamsonia byssochlamydoides]|uniref:uncharacterized protein n=1 Tax=Rasamsonia byssochlamydoides TaxID=89139 RepID=UPI003744508E